MKKKILTLTIAVFTVFGLYAQDTNHRLPRFTGEIGFGTSPLIGIGAKNLSPWGKHYNGNFNNGLSFNAQFDYIFRDGTLLGFKVDMFASSANYTLADNRRVAESVNIMYLAPQWGGARSISPRIVSTGHIGLGYGLFESRGLLDDIDYRIHSHMFGGNVDFSLSYLLGQNMSVGVRSSFSVLASFDKQHRNIGGERSTFTMDEMNRIALMKMDLSLFWRVQF